VPFGRKGAGVFRVLHRLRNLLDVNVTRKLSLFLLLAVLPVWPTYASMVLDRTVLTFRTGELPRQDVSVANPDKENLYIEVSVLEVTNPGTDKETREVVKDPESIGLIATPHKLMVPPGARRTVRLVNLNGHGDSEKVYRVNVTPKPPPAKTTGMAVRVVVAYQLLIFVEPLKPEKKLVATRNGQVLEIANEGNINVMLSQGQQCSTAKKEICTELTGKRLYPGNRMQVSLPLESGLVFFQATSRGETRTQEF